MQNISLLYSIIASPSLTTTTTPIHPSTTYYTTDKHKNVGLAVGVIIGLTVLLVVLAYVCFKKKTDNAVGPSPEDDTAELHYHHSSQRAPAMYIVTPAFESSTRTLDV